MKHVTFEDEVLGRCADDYEAPHTIAGDLARDLGRRVTEAEVRAAFVSFVSRGYVFERATNRYMPVSDGDAPSQEAIWFKMTAEGRRYYER